MPTFPTYDPNAPPLTNSPSPLNILAWEQLLEDYPGDLKTIIVGILRFGALLGYKGPERHILSTNHTSVDLDPAVMREKLDADILYGRIEQVEPDFPFISSPLGFVPKPDNTLRRIHDLSHPKRKGTSTNAGIPDNASAIKFIRIKDVVDMVLEAGKGCTLLKKDIKDAFRIIPVAVANRWLLGFSWEGTYYREKCLPFGLATAPVIFNFFAEAFHWILQSFLQCQYILHYLDDFIFALPRSQATHQAIQQFHDEYRVFTDALGIPRNDKKDAQGTCVTILGIEIDTVALTARLPREKMDRAQNAAAHALTHKGVTLLQIQQLAGFLSFCSEVVQLGRIYMRNIWNFVQVFESLHLDKHAIRRLPPLVRKDLAWWATLLPKYNGVLFFDEESRPIIHLYSDASIQGMGAFYFQGQDPDWRNAAYALPIEQAFSARVKHSDQDVFDINIFELGAILLAFQKWAPTWHRCRIFIHTDSNTAQNGLLKESLKGESFHVLRQIHLLAAEWDIALSPTFIPGKENILADAISRFDLETIANWCPLWHILSSSLLLRQNGWTASELIRAR
jgi:Reverse transcriptase (RNA-dependent DNA polymerase)